MTMKTIDIYDTNGVFVVLAEGQTQSPIVMETEGDNSTFDAAQDRAKKGQWALRTCVCRLVPVSGNELLYLDMIRMQPEEEKGMPF